MNIPFLHISHWKVTGFVVFCHFQVFPNISYWIFPHNVVTLITSPTEDPGVTKEKFTVMMDKDIKQKMEDGDEAVRAKVKDMVDFYVLTNNQDIGAVESVQQGIRSNNVYRGGRLSAKFEEPVYRFQQYLIDYMTDHCMNVHHGDADFVHSALLKRGKATSVNGVNGVNGMNGVNGVNGVNAVNGQETVNEVSH